MPAKTVNDIVALCKRRGFIFTGSEIYGGLGGAYDYGPYGVELMKNIRNAWWNSMIYSRDDIEGLDAALISNRLLWKYSGHEAGFSDPLVECKKCGTVFTGGAYVPETPMAKAATRNIKRIVGGN